MSALVFTLLGLVMPALCAVLLYRGKVQSKQHYQNLMDSIEQLAQVQKRKHHWKGK